jgi:uncharacterized protein YceH (UPF0502 family)
VLELDESEVRAAAQHLGALGYARLATGPGSRTAKYRQLFSEALDLMPAEVSILAVLMLRGTQTVSELKTRTERLHQFASNDEVTEWLTRLDEKELVHLLPKQPGQREERWTHLLAEGPTGAGPVDEPDDQPAEERSTVERRLARVEQQVEELTRRLAERGLLD